MSNGKGKYQWQRKVHFDIFLRAFEDCISEMMQSSNFLQRKVEVLIDVRSLSEISIEHRFIHVIINIEPSNSDAQFQVQ